MRKEDFNRDVHNFWWILKVHWKLWIFFNEESEDLKDESISLDTDSTELDSFFDSIYNGVEDANDLISQINLKKQTLEDTEKEIANLKEQIDREKAEFSKYMDSQRQVLENERRQLKEKSELQSKIVLIYTLLLVTNYILLF